MLFRELRPPSHWSHIPTHLPAQFECYYELGLPLQGCLGGLSGGVKPALLKHASRIGKIPRRSEGVYERMLAVTLLFCHLSREITIMQKMVCNS